MKTALILGATSDIGIEIAILLAKMNYQLSLTGRNLNKLEDLKNRIQLTEKIDIQNYFLDILDYSSHQKFYSSINTKPEIVFCCIGYYEDQTKARKEFDELYKTISINFLGIASILNIISNDFESKKNGSIIVLSSVAGVRGRQLNYIYGSAKSGITTYLSGLRNRLFNSNVSITTILLGPVYTKMSDGHKLIPFITLKPEIAAKKIIDAGISKKDSIYIFWVWKYIMFIINSIPEFIFKRLLPF